MLTDTGAEVDPYTVVYGSTSAVIPNASNLLSLLSKLEALGITGKVSGWIASWLNGRQQRVVLNGHKSSWIQVLSGVPQGSVLGPLLFIIFVNDLDDGVISKLLKFADDVKLIGPVATERDVDSLRADLQLLVEWSADWQMLFNVEKCKVLHMGYNNMCAGYFIGNSEIQRVLNHWNALTQHAVDCNTVNSSKRCVDHYIRDKGYL